MYASTRVEELAPVPWTDQQKLEFLAMQFNAQHEHYRVHYAEAEFSVVLVDGEPAGRLYLYRGERDLRLVDIALLPQFRGGGLGTRLIRDVLEEGDRTGKTVSIHVEVENPARRLYDRLGFVPAGETGVYVLMERPPAVPLPAAD